MAKKLQKNRKVNLTNLAGVVSCSPKFIKEATIDDVTYSDYDRNINGFWIYLKYTAGATQGFGGFCFNTEEKVNKLFSSICQLFDVSNISQLKDKKCLAIFNKSGYNQIIVGIKPINSDRAFIIDKFREDIGYKRSDTILEEKKRINDEILIHRNHISRLKKSLTDIKKTFDEIYSSN